MGYRNYNIYIHSSDLDAVELGLIAIFEQEGYHRIPKLPLMPEYYNSYYGYTRRREDPRILDSLRVAVIFPGGSGWAMMQTYPFDILSRLAPGSERPRLAGLTVELGCNAFQLNMYSGDTLILLEANTDGQVVFSGSSSGLHGTPEEIEKMIPKENEKERFRLIEVPEQIQLILEDEEVWIVDQVEAIAALLCGPSFDYYEDNASALVCFANEPLERELEALGAHILYFQGNTVSQLE